MPLIRLAPKDFYSGIKPANSSPAGGDHPNGWNAQGLWILSLAKFNFWRLLGFFTLSPVITVNDQQIIDQATAVLLPSKIIDMNLFMWHR